MSDGDGGWRPTNVMEGVNRQFAWADNRVRTASIVGGAWGTLMVGIGLYQLTGALGVARIEWNLGGGIAALLFSLGAASRNLLATAFLAMLCVGELPALTTSLGEVFVEGGFVDQTLAALRCAALPAVLYNGIQGYAGAYEYQKLRRPHSARSWRAINPAMLKGAIFSAFGVLVIGFIFGWSNAIMEGFTNPGAAVLNADGSLDVSSRLSKHMQDNATNVQGFRQRGADEERAEEEERRKAREEAEKEKAARLAGEHEEQWKVEELENRYPKDSPANAGPVDGKTGTPRHQPQLKGPAYAAAQEAIAFAGNSDSVGCLTESLRRHDACKDEDCRHLAGVFVTACLPESKPTEGFCAGVPSVLSVVETTAWRTRLCASGEGAKACHAFYANLQMFCHPGDAEKIAEKTTG
ncbi:MAG TPA: hypothetical protein VEL28_09295 [Candidatus Binatia bacterium]|nr:hypothetical protein [Candidatus Binatia bacterium]